MKALAVIITVADLANDIIIHDIKNGMMVIIRVIFLPSAWTDIAAIGDMNMLTNGTIVAIQDASVLVVGMSEFDDWRIDDTGDVHPVVIPVCE